MAYHTVEDGPWPRGVTVAAWPTSSVVSGQPIGSPVSTGVAHADGVVSLGGLTEGASYTAFGHAGAQTFEAMNQESRIEALEASSGFARVPVAATGAQALVNSASPGDLVDFGGLRHALPSTLLIPAGVKIANFDLAATGAFPAVQLAAGAMLARGRTTRPTWDGATAPTTPNSANVLLAGDGARVLDVDTVESALGNITINNGVKDCEIRGGQHKLTARRNNAGIVVAQGGSNPNVGHHVVGLRNTSDSTCPNGILMFDGQSCRIERNVIRTLRRLPTLTATGWTLTSGSVYKWPEPVGRSDAIVKANGTQLQENFSTPTTPGAGQMGRGGDGFIYVRLSDSSDPNSKTMTVDTLGGYALMVYATLSTNPAFRNVFSRNEVDDVDGYGIYIQASVSAAALGNVTDHNTIRRAFAIDAVQTVSLPPGAIGVAGGGDTLLDGDVIEDSGVHGVAVWPQTSGLAAGGRMIGVQVHGSRSGGIWTRSDDWTHEACAATENTGHGFTCHTAAGESITGLVYETCISTDNTLRGLNADNTAGAALSVVVTGGVYRNNGTDDVRLHNCDANSRVQGKVLTDSGGILVSGTPNATVDQDANSPNVQTLNTNAAFSLVPLASPVQTIHTGTLTANRVVTLSTFGATPGMRFKISRSGGNTGGPWTLDVGTGPLKSLATNEWCEVVYNGTAWVLAQAGSL